MRTHKEVKSWLTLGAMASIVAIALAGCSGSTVAAGNGGVNADFTEPTEPVTITYAGAAYSADDIKPVLDAFHKAHPMITVKYEAVPFADFNSVLASRLTNAKNAIDVFDTDMPRTNAYQARGWLADLSKAFPNLKNEVDPGSLGAATVDGKLVTMPYQTSTNLMYYNKKLLTAAGIAAPSASVDARMDWETVTKNAKATQAAGAKYGLVFDQIDRYYQLEPLPVSADGGPGATDKGNLTPAITNDGWNKAFTWYGSLFKDGISPRGVAVADTPDLFASGQVAYYVGGPWWAPKFEGQKDLSFGIAPFPAFQGGKAATPTGGWSLGLNPKSSNTAAALIFMKFFGVDNGGYAKYLTALAVPPSNLTGAAKFYSSDALANPQMAGAVELMKSELAHTATLRLQTVGYVEFEDIMTKTLDDIINGADAPTALKSASTDLAAAWAKYKE